MTGDKTVLATSAAPFKPEDRALYPLKKIFPPINSSLANPLLIPPAQSASANIPSKGLLKDSGSCNPPCLSNLPKCILSVASNLYLFVSTSSIFFIPFDGGILLEACKYPLDNPSALKSFKNLT